MSIYLLCDLVIGSTSKNRLFTGAYGKPTLSGKCDEGDRWLLPVSDRLSERDMDEISSWASNRAGVRLNSNLDPMAKMRGSLYFA